MNTSKLELNDYNGYNTNINIKQINNQLIIYSNIVVYNMTTYDFKYQIDNCKIRQQSKYLMMDKYK